MNTTSKFVLMIAAIASLTIALTLQEQDVLAFNDNNENVFNTHSHTNCGKEIGSCGGNDGFITNDEKTHCNNNDNTNNAVPPKFHCNDKPDNGK